MVGVEFKGVSNCAGWMSRKKKRKMIEKLGRGRRAEMGGGGAPAGLSVVGGEGGERGSVGLGLGLGLGFSLWREGRL